MANPSSRGVFIVISVAHEPDLLDLTGTPAHRGARWDVQPHSPGRLAVELQPGVHPPERVVRRHPDRPPRFVAYRQPPPFPAVVQRYRLLPVPDRARGMRARPPGLAQH